MRKVIKKSGITRGEITISVSHNLTYNIDPLEWAGEVHAVSQHAVLDLSKKSYTIVGSIGGTSIISVGHVKPGALESVTNWVDSWLNQYIDALDDGKAEEGAMIKHGFMI